MKKIILFLILTMWFTKADKIDEYMIDMWYTQELATAIIDNCKDTKNPDWCMMFASSIGKQESGAGKYYNLFGMMDKKTIWLNKVQQVEKRVKTYNKRRYKHKKSSDFLYKSKYCTEEPWAERWSWCPNRQKNVQKYNNDYKAYMNNEKVEYTWDNAQAVYQEKTQYPKKICQLIYTAKQWQKLQIDTIRGKFKQWLWLTKGDKIFVCG